MSAVSRLSSAAAGWVLAGLVALGVPSTPHAQAPAGAGSRPPGESTAAKSSATVAPGGPAQTLSAPPHALTVFEPRPAVRSLDAAVIDYYLPKDVDAITIEILEGSGAVVRRVTGSDAEDSAITDANTKAEVGPGPKRPEAPTRKAGLNHYSWDLRYEGATTLEGVELAGVHADAGPMAVPGSYQVRVSAGAERANCQLVVQMDPQLKDVTLEDLRDQFDLAIQVRDATSRANEAVIRIRDLKQQIAERVPKARSPVIGLAADATTRALGEVEGELCQVRNRSTHDSPSSPAKLNNRLAALRRSIEGGDSRPTEAERAEFAKLLAELEAQLQRLAAIEANHLEAFNRLLTNGGLEPVSIGPARRP